MYMSQTIRTLVAQIHHPHEHIKPTTLTNAMKTCPFYTTLTRVNIFQLLLHGDSVHLYNHCTNLNITLIKHRSKIDISNAIQTLTTLLKHTPYNPNLQHVSFQTILLTTLHHYENFTYIPNTGPHVLVCHHH